MSFDEGQAVIHPFLGPARVIEVATRTLAGETVDYVQLQVVRDGMKLGIPVTKAKEIGLRPVSSRERIDELFAILRGASEVETGKWAQRIKELQNRMATGEIDEICVVVRDIKRREKAGGAEAALLRNASERLALEIGLGLEIETDEAMELIFDAVLSASGTPADDDRLAAA